MHINRKAAFSLGAVLIAAGLYKLAPPVKGAQAQQNSPTPATIVSGNGSPATVGMLCGVGMASPTSSSIYDDRSITGNANTIWKCRLNSDGVTYSWQQPQSAPSFYNTAGVLSNAHCFVDTITTNTSGQGTVNWTSAGFTVAPKVQLQIVTTGTAASNMAWAGISGKTATSANITVTVPSTVVLGGLAVQLASQAYSVDISACGI